MAIQLNDNIEVKAPKPSEYRYFHPDNRPWLSVAEVNSTIPSTERHPGLVVFVVDTKYIYKDGILDTNLVLDNEGGNQDLQSVTSQGNTTSNEVIFQSTVFVDRITNNSNLSSLKIEDDQFVFSVNDGKQFSTPTDEPTSETRTIATREWVADNASGVTNLSYTPSPTNGIVTSDTGTNATIPLANSTNAGLFAPAEKTKLASITEIFTTNLKTAYDNTVSWISTNGSNLLNHLSTLSNAHPMSAITGLNDALDEKVDKADLEVTPVEGVINSTPEMSDRVLILNVGSTATTFNINHELRNVGLKKDGSGVVTFVSGAGRTLNTLTSTDKLTSNGAVGLLDANGTVDNLYTNDGTEEALLKSGYKNGALIATDFTGSPRKATVAFVTNYPDANYRIWINFIRFSGSLYSLPYVITQSSITNAGFEIELNTADEPTGLIVEWNCFRNE